MPLPTRFVPRAALVSRHKSWITLALLAGVCLAELAGAVACLLLRLRDAHAGLPASSGVILLVAACLQLRLVLTASRAGRLATSQNPLVEPGFWRAFLIGAFLAYLAALAVGPLPYVGTAWIAALSVWFTLLLLPLAASPRAAEVWRRWTQGHTARRLAWLVYASIAIVVVGEVGLRAQRAAVRGLSASVPVAQVEHFDAQPAPAAVVEPLEMRMALLKPGHFRVAIVDASGEYGSEGYLSRVEQGVPGVEVVSLEVELSPRATRSGRLASQLEACGADLVLAVLPICKDLARRSEPLGYFDWRRFELASLLFGRDAEVERAPLKKAANFEAFLADLAPQLAACRTPIDDATQARWQCLFESLDELVAGCRAAEVPVALVVVPAEFQLNRALSDTLLRRNGVSPDRFDAELPQRRLASFAEHRKLPLVDLLPHLRLCRQSIYRRHTTALNDAGNSAAATAIGGWLQSRYGSQLAAQ